MRYLRQTIYTVGVLCRPHAIVGSLTLRHCSGADGVTVSYACITLLTRRGGNLRQDRTCYTQLQRRSCKAPAPASRTYSVSLFPSFVRSFLPSFLSLFSSFLSFFLSSDSVRLSFTSSSGGTQVRRCHRRLTLVDCCL